MKFITNVTYNECTALKREKYFLQKLMLSDALFTDRYGVIAYLGMNIGWGMNIKT